MSEPPNARCQSSSEAPRIAGFVSQSYYFFLRVFSVDRKNQVYTENQKRISKANINCKHPLSYMRSALRKFDKNYGVHINVIYTLGFTGRGAP